MKVVGEAYLADSEAESVQLCLADGSSADTSIVLATNKIFKNVAAANDIFAIDSDDTVFGIVLQDSRLAVQCHGRNLQKQTLQQCMQSVTRISGLQSDSLADDADFQKQLDAAVDPDMVKLYWAAVQAFGPSATWPDLVPQV